MGNDNIDDIIKGYFYFRGADIYVKVKFRYDVNLVGDFWGVISADAALWCMLIAREVWAKVYMLVC